MSSNEIAIRVVDVAKYYQIYDSPGARLKQFFLPRLAKVFGARGKQYFSEFRALDQISFEVKKGETVGIIGRNGSGKSTLLQMICGTLTPSAGEIEVNGKIAALLELGSGFNPEFTGRENVYLNASVLGLSKIQIDQKYDDITKFADIDAYIDQPVNTYSTGMVVRLAFSVIAHVDADILIIDEALAVGDAIFTQKCMRFLRSFMETGTVLFVSHDLGSVVNLCDQAIWLDKGVIKDHGAATVVSQSYADYCAQKVNGSEVVRLSRSSNLDETLTASSSNKEQDVKVSVYENILNSDSWGSGEAEITKSTICIPGEVSKKQFSGGETILLKIDAICRKKIIRPIIGFFLKDRLGQSLFGEHTFNHINEEFIIYSGERVSAEFIFSLPLLPNGDYSVTVSIAEGDPKSPTQHHWVHDAILIRVFSEKLRYGLVGIPFTSVVISREFIS